MTTIWHVATISCSTLLQTPVNGDVGYLTEMFFWAADWDSLSLQATPEAFVATHTQFDTTLDNPDSLSELQFPQMLQLKRSVVEHQKATIIMRRTFSTTSTISKNSYVSSLKANHIEFKCPLSAVSGFIIESVEWFALWYSSECAWKDVKPDRSLISTGNETEYKQPISQSRVRSRVDCSLFSATPHVMRLKFC